MPLQNRADPFGMLHAVAARGLFTGNRGVIHDPATATLLKRRWTTKAWIICALAHPAGARRQPMGRNTPAGGAGWTALFFLDEVTALAAGHRPCFYCRREAAQLFSHCFSRGNRLAAAPAPAMDAILHAQRLATGAAAPLLSPHKARGLPDGAMVATGSRVWAMYAGKALPWSFSGYGVPEALPGGTMRMLTPPSAVAALAAGYAPSWHSSACSEKPGKPHA